MDRSERFISSYLAAFFGTLGVLLVAYVITCILAPDWRAPGWVEVLFLFGLPFWCLGWGYVGVKRAQRRTRLFGRRTGARLAKMLNAAPITRTHPRF